MSEITTEDVSDEPEEPSEVELAIAEQIAQLSLASEAPTEFEPPGRAIDASEVDLRSASWMTSVGLVQGWLRLPNELDLESPERFIESLARGLEFEDTEEAVAWDGRRPYLTATGLDGLGGRLQLALRLQEAFLADLEADGGTLASATGRWIEAWDEEDAEIDEGSGPVTAKAHTWNINEFSDRAIRGRLNLSPSYQRGDVWPTTDAQMLIESILRG